MKYIKSILIVMLFLSAPLFASTQPVAAVQLSKLLNQFTTFQAHFTQVTQTSQMSVLQKNEGQMMLARPDRFRWETQKPLHQIVITNGKKIWIYDVNLKQATEQSVANLPMNPAKLLSGDVNALMKRFTVTMIPHDKITVFQLVPKKKNPAFRSIAIAFEDAKLIRMQIQTSLAQTSTFTFSHIKMNPRLSRSLFEFHAPEGVTVLR